MTPSKDAVLSLRKERSRMTRILLGFLTLLILFFYEEAIWGQEWSFSGSRISPFTILYRMFVIPLTTPSYWQDVPSRLALMGETVAIAYAGGLAASLLALPLAFLSARNIGGRYHFIGKMILNTIRAIPEIIFGLLFVAALGIGPYPGVLAITINSVGMIGKLYTETIESINMQKVEAVRAAGGNQLQVLCFGVLPQVLPEFASFSLYRFEIDVRASTILGLVGAGGIGLPLLLAQQQRNWEDVGLILLIIILCVSLLDRLSAYIRKKLLED